MFSGKLTKKQAVLELAFAGALWGFGFVATVWALQSYHPIETLFYRFILAYIVGELFYFLFVRRSLKIEIEDLKAAFPAGALLALMMIPQTVGLMYTTATNAGFLTTLYVVLVPVINHIFLKTPSAPRSYFTILVALFGAFLLMSGGFSHWQGFNQGDLAVLACSVIAALHIIYVGKVSPRVKNHLRFNNFQSLFCLAAVIPFLPFQENYNFHFAWGLPLVGILFLAIGSSAIAFVFQIRAQTVLNDTTASMLFLLESPFAFMFGVLLLGERLNIWQFSGAMLILVSSALTILWDSREYSKTKNLK